MKIIAFNGSPRAERGNTAIIVEAFLEGCREAGAETEHIYLAKKKIAPCMGCFTCWTKTPGVCVIKDDMKDLLKKVTEPDIAVYATPLYVDNVSGIMKNFMDRLIPTAMPQFERDAEGRMRHPERQKKQARTVVISNSGFPQRDQFDVLRLLFRRLAGLGHSELAGEIYRDEGELLRNASAALKPVIDRYKELVKKAGREVVEKGRLSEATMKELEKPLIPYEDYIKSANESWG
ncbi:MAG: flavodoxin family protein [Candidatus Omnitrophica bacterium]|nr:flavodoxin family protein [Candidatus Omnitrophota bacterium]